MLTAPADRSLAAAAAAAAAAAPPRFTLAPDLDPARIAIVDGPTGARTSYAELGDRIARIAGWLEAAGVAPGDRIALWLPNVALYPALCLAAWRRRAIIVPLGPLATAREVGGALADAAVVVTIPPLAEAALATARGRVVVLGQGAGGIDLAEVLAAAPGAALEPRADDVAARFASSGTTGLPKQVELTHRNLAAACAQVIRAARPGPDEVTLALAPYCHILGFVVELLLPLARGHTIVTMPRFDPDELLRLLEQHRVTNVAVPPPLASMLAHHPAVAARDLGALRFIAVGGAPLPPAVQRALAARLPGCAIAQGYGLTETCAAISVGTFAAGSPPGTVGWLVPDTEARLVDPETGAEVAPGATGELWVRGPQVMRGYADDPEATAAVLTADGWLRTGDLARLGSDGTLEIVGRLKEVMKVNGFQVAPAELEQLLVAHPGVADAAVVPRADERAGEVPVALVVPRPGATLDEGALLDWLAPQVAPYKRPVAARFIAALPRTPSGKLLRRALVS